MRARSREPGNEGKVSVHLSRLVDTIVAAYVVNLKGGMTVRLRMAFYNHRRLHSSLGYLSPMQYEQRWYEAQRKKAA